MYHYMSSYQNCDYSANKNILRPCRFCDAAYNRDDMGRVGLIANLQNDRLSFGSDVRPRFHAPEDHSPTSSESFRTPDEREQLPIGPEIRMRSNVEDAVRREFSDEQAGGIVQRRRATYKPPPPLPPRRAMPKSVQTFLRPDER